MKIGVFDSGIGGQAVAKSLQKAFPFALILTVSDVEHLPYGIRTAEDILELTDTAIQPLLREGCDVIVIACNSATAAAIETVRSRYPKQLFVGLEPMLKPAAQLTATGVIAMCATPATLSSTRYQQAKQRFTQHISVIEPDCSSWASLIEENTMTHTIIAATIESVLAEKADVIILGCTHYHWIKEDIETLVAGRAQVIEPSEAIARRVGELLGTK